MSSKHVYFSQNLNSPVVIFEPTIKKFDLKKDYHITSTVPKPLTKEIPVIVSRVENHYYEHEYVYQYIPVVEVHHYHHQKR